MGGIPLRPDPTALRTMQRRSFNRAAAALVMTHRRGTQPQDILKSAWRDDDDAGVILRAAQSPLATTGTFPQIQATKVLPMLAPDSASSKLLAMGANLDLTGIATIKLPYIGGSGRPARALAGPQAAAGAAKAPARPRHRARAGNRLGKRDPQGNPGRARGLNGNCRPGAWPIWRRTSRRH
jgi:hypothetical protein